MRDLIPGRAGGALSHGRHSGGRQRAAPPSPACGPQAKLPPPAFTAPIGLASNSLLEAVVFGARVAADINASPVSATRVKAADNRSCSAKISDALT